MTGTGFGAPLVGTYEIEAVGGVVQLPEAWRPDAPLTLAWLLMEDVEDGTWRLWVGPQHEPDGEAGEAGARILDRGSVQLAPDDMSVPLPPAFLARLGGQDVIAVGVCSHVELWTQADYQRVEENAEALFDQLSAWTVARRAEEDA